MKGRPKFKIGDKVVITLTGFEDERNNGRHTGEIYIVDENGTWDDPSDVSYDIMIHDFHHSSTPDKVTDCLIKHCTETTVKRYRKRKEYAEDK